jgi:hypothetical protein
LLGADSVESEDLRRGSGPLVAELPVLIAISAAEEGAVNHVSGGFLRKRDKQKIALAPNRAANDVEIGGLVSPRRSGTTAFAFSASVVTGPSSSSASVETVSPFSSASSVVASETD